MERLFNLQQNLYYSSGGLAEALLVIDKRTMLTPTKLRVLYEHAITVKVLALDGDVVDAGVWEGGSTYALASALPDKTIHAFDSWDGLPTPGVEDLVGLDEQPMGRGWGKCQPPTDFLSPFGDRIIFHQGWFKDTLSDVEGTEFCLVHIDCDQYQSVKECLEFFYPNMVKNGIIVIDDYGFELTPGATIATDEFFVDKMNSISYSLHAGLNIRIL